MDFILMGIFVIVFVINLTGDFTWKPGRQHTGYEKIKVYEVFNMDCYLLRYKEGSSIPTHTDPVPNRKHYRLNFVLKKAEKGGMASYGPSNASILNTIVFSENKRVVFFRPDLIPHRVSEIRKGERLVLTFGIAI